MARFIEVTEAGSSLFLNVDAIAEFETGEDGAHITMLWSRGPGRQAVHSVREAVEEIERRIAEDADVGRGVDRESRLERVKAMAERVRLRAAVRTDPQEAAPPPAEG